MSKQKGVIYKMKKIMMMLLMVLFAFSVMAKDLTESKVVASVGTVISATPIEWYSLEILDGNANTAVVRAIHFYNNVSIQVSDNPSTGYMFSVTATVGTYYPKEIFKGDIYNKWNYTVIEGRTCSAGLCVSPTTTAAAGSYPTIFVKYK